DAPRRGSFGPAAAASSLLPRQLLQLVQERFEVDRLDQMPVEARFLRALPVRALTISGDRDELDPVRPGIASEPLGDLVAVEAGQPDVQEYDLGAERLRLLQRRDRKSTRLSSSHVKISYA